MRDELAFPAVLGSVTCSEDTLFDIVKGIVELRFVEAVSVAENFLLK